MASKRNLVIACNQLSNKFFQSDYRKLYRNLSAKDINSRLLELLVYLRLAEEARYLADIYIEKFDDKCIFPQGPAKDSSHTFSYFSFTYKDEKYKIVLGLGVKDRYGEISYPDISLIKGNDLICKNVVRIWDAKYTDNEEGQLSEAEVAKFVSWLEHYELTTKKRGLNIVDKESEFSYLNRNSIVSNCKRYSKKNVEYLKEKNIREVVCFPKDVKFRPK